MALLVVIGYGPGISQATAERFGREGFDVALVGRSRERVESGASRLTNSGVPARGYAADASDLGSLRATLQLIRSEQGPVTALLWTAFRSGKVRDVLATGPDHVLHVFDVGVVGLLAAVQEIVSDLKKSDGAAVLVANGALGEATTEADGYAKYLNNDGVALENAAKTKLVGVLAERLRAHEVYVGEITIAGSVAGTATGTVGSIDPAEIADRFWAMSRARTTTRVRIVG